MSGEAQQVLSEKDKYLSLFESFEKTESAKIPSWLTPMRKAAISRFAEIGFPTARHEEWKYTNVDPIAKTSFKLASKPSSNGLPLSKFGAALSEANVLTIREIENKLGLSKGIRLVFVNGIYSESLSDSSRIPSGVRVLNFRDAWDKDSKIIEQHLTQYADCKRSAFTALNTAFIRDGAFIHLQEGKVIKEPIYLVFVSTTHEEKIISQPRNLVIAGKGSAATLLESYVSLADDSYFTNAVTEIVLNEGASIDYYKIQKESQNAFHVGTTQVKCDRDSVFSSFFLDTGGRIARNNLHVSLDSEGCQCMLSGLYITAGVQHVDNFTVIDHTKPHGTSRQLYKGILDGKSTAVFYGKIFVRQDAQKTDAAQKNKNLLLSDGAKVDTRPQLEIFADDVKCAHGAAVGQLSEDEIFYLKSRGMSEEKAKKVLTYGFANEVANGIKFEPVRNELDQLLLARLDTKKSSHGKEVA